MQTGLAQRDVHAILSREYKFQSMLRLLMVLEYDMVSASATLRVQPDAEVLRPGVVTFSVVCQPLIKQNSFSAL